MMEILFICTGNTCRTPMAQFIAEKIFAGAGINAAVKSAGVAAGRASPVSAYAREAAASKGLRLDGHMSRQLTEKDLAAAGLALTMTNSHKKFIAERFPEHTGKVYTIYEYASGEPYDVADPFGQTAEDYIKCFNELWALIEQLAEKVKNVYRIK